MSNCRRLLARASALLVGLAVLPAVPASARQQDLAALTAPQAYEDPLRRDTPRGAFMGFVDAIQRDDLALAADYLQWPRQRMPIGREEAANQLRFVLNHGFEGNLDRLSRDPAGAANDGLPADRERVGTAVLASGERVEIYLARVPQDSGIPIWLVASDTVSDIPRMYKNAGLPQLERRLPKVLTRTDFGRLQLWVPLALLLLLPALYVVSAVILWLVLEAVRLVLRLRGRPIQGRRSPIVRALARPTVFILTVLLHRLLSPHIGIPLLHRQYYSRTVTVVLLLTAVWWVWRLIDLAAGRTREGIQPDSPRAAQRVYSLSRRLLKGVVAFVALMVGLSAFGVNLTTALAGLGIGGLALAFGAQKTIENVFGGIFVLSDRSIVVGDFCRIGNYTGTVEDVGLRSMQLRTLERTVVSVPNGTLATMEVENFGRRDKFLFNPTIALRYETTLPQLRRVLADIRAVLAAEASVEASTARARFVRLGAYSFDIEILAYVRAKDYAAFLAEQEGLLLRVIEAIKAAGTDIAFPSQTMYMKPAAALPASAAPPGAADDGK
ncbi:MAG TPA: mechanosensitive ion channel family protein [Vicinamibacterales bacterium]|nr:mechanosensitive ion channel family protein [Vicinamibacterales bacterium]HPK70642.1 mechanosensitive ion channel family protein [Vicinamibacterales bacterium]